jgi:hypothetical protein
MKIVRNTNEKPLRGQIWYLIAVYGPICKPDQAKWFLFQRIAKFYMGPEWLAENAMNRLAARESAGDDPWR